MHDVQTLIAKNDAKHLRQREIIIDDEYARVHLMSFQPWVLHRLHRRIPSAAAECDLPSGASLLSRIRALLRPSSRHPAILIRNARSLVGGLVGIINLDPQGLHLQSARGDGKGAWRVPTSVWLPIAIFAATRAFDFVMLVIDCQESARTFPKLWAVPSVPYASKPRIPRSNH